MAVSYSPTLGPSELLSRLRALLVPGSITDPDLERRLARLELLFQIYVTTCPVPFWTPGLVLTGELMRQTELYLPLSEIERTVRRFSQLAAARSAPLSFPFFHDACCWLQVLDRHDWRVTTANPAALLRPLLVDWPGRIGFLFSLHLPERHGGGFNRYPAQMRALGGWLAARHGGSGVIRCLDAACGTGEGTWDLAELLADAGVPAACREVTGLSLGAFELFAAAHAFFPHDPIRQQAYRERIVPLVAAGISARILFRQADLKASETLGGRYSVIICNGLLGGPMLHEKESVGMVVKRLAAGLEPGGILMVADRFHAGWRKVVPRRALEELFVHNGLRLVDGGEGIAGIRT